MPIFAPPMKPCPFCGAKAWLRDNQACGWRVECDDCQIGNLDYADRETAIGRWEMRTADAQKRLISDETTVNETGH